MEITIEYIILGMIMLIMIYLIFYPYIKRSSIKKPVPYAKGRPYLHDITAGIYSEVTDVETIGEEKIRFWLHNGERRTYKKEQLSRSNEFGIGRTIYTHKETNNDGQRSESDSTLARTQQELNEYKQRGREAIEEHINTGTRLGELAKPVRGQARDHQ